MQPTQTVDGHFGFIDENGNYYGVKQIAGKPRVSSMPYLYDVAEGNVTNHSTWSKIGACLSLANVNQDITPLSLSGSGVYAWLNSATRMQIVSSSVQDETTGTGIRSVTIYYLDTSYQERSETITLSGTVAKATSANNYYRINNMRATTVGSQYSAFGTIVLQNSAASARTSYAVISSGNTRQRQCVYTVPTSKTLYVTSIRFSSISGSKQNSAIFTTRATFDDKLGTVLSPNFFMPFNEIGMQDESISIPLDPPTKLPETTDLKVSVYNDQAGAFINCALRGWLES